MEYVGWLSALGAVLALDHALFGQFMFSQPLVIGGLFGALMGDWSTGLLAGALIQLLWLGIIPVGAYIPPEHTITGGIAVAQTVMLVHQQGHALGPSFIFALAISIPAGVLAGQMDAGIRHGVNNRLARRAESLAQLGKWPRLGAYHLLALIPSWIKGWIVYALWLGPIAVLAGRVFAELPLKVVAGLELAFWAFPALGFAVVVDMFNRERFPWGAVAVFAATGLVLGFWPSWAQAWFLLVLVGGAVWVGWRKAS